MNKNIVYVVILAVLCALAGVAVGVGLAVNAGFPTHGQMRCNFADRAECFMGRGSMGHDKGRMRGEKLLEKLTTKLDLDKEQQGKVKAILDNARQEIDALGKDVRKSIANIKEKGDKEIMDVLKPEQQEKFKAMIEEFKKRREARHAKD